MTKRIQKSGVTPNFVPKSYAYGDTRRAYLLGWNHGHGIACHNVPSIGEKLWLESEGHITVDADNIADVHASVCHEAADNSRCYSPFEFIAHEFNSAGEWKTERLWEAFEAGTADAIFADLRGYTYEVEG
jgi:hypothetical protein